MHEAAAPGPRAGPAVLTRGGPWCNRPAGASTQSPSSSAAPEHPWARAVMCSPAGSRPAPVPGPQAPGLDGACPAHGAWAVVRHELCEVHGAWTFCVVHRRGAWCTVTGVVHGHCAWSMVRDAWHTVHGHGAWCMVHGRAWAMVQDARSMVFVHGAPSSCTVHGPRCTLPVPEPSSWWPGDIPVPLPVPSPRRFPPNYGAALGPADKLACQRPPRGPGGSLVQMNIDWLEAPGRRALHPGHVCNKAGPPGRA